MTTHLETKEAAIDGNGEAHRRDLYSARRRLAVGLILLGFMLAYCLAWIWQGLDLTDEGFNLTNQLQIINDNPNYRYGPAWLSNLAGGVWLKVIGDPGLIGARVGWAVTIAITGLLTYWTVSEYVSPLRSAVATMATLVTICGRGVLVISYNTFPAMLLIGAAMCLLLSQKTDRRLGGRILTAIVAGVLLALSFLAKFPLFLAFALPAVPVLVLVWCRVRVGKASVLVSIVTWCSSGVTLLAALGWMRHVGRLDEYLGVFRGDSWEPMENIYSLSSLAALYVRGSVTAGERAVGMLVLATALAIVAHHACKRRQAGLMAYSVYGLTMSILVVSITWIISLGDSRSMYETWLVGTTLGLGLFCLLVERYDMPHQTRSVDLIQLLSIGICVPPIIMAGSSNGVVQMIYGLWILLPAVLLLSLRAVNHTVFTRLKLSIDADKARLYFIGYFMALVATGAMVRFVSSYRDLPNRLRLTATLPHPRLKYVHTSQERATSVSEVLRELEKRVQPGDEILAFNGLPMVYYLTRTRPVLSIPWLTIINIDYLNSQLAKIGDSISLPSLAVRAKTNTARRTWAVEPPLPSTQRVMEKIESLDDTLRRLGYQEAWSNADFVIMTRVDPVDAIVKPSPK